ncbi:DUF2779 domain-containing protein [Mycoplasma sp. 128]
MTNKKYIQYKDYFTYNVSSEYWLTHTEEDFLLEHNVQNASYYDEDDDELEDDDENKEWANFIGLFETTEEFNYSDKFGLDLYRAHADNKAFNLVNKSINLYINKYFQNFKSVIIPLSTKLEQKIELTKKHLDDPKIEVIIGPVFEYKDALAKPAAYNKKTGLMLDKKPVAKSSLDNLLKGYWNCQIAKLSGVKNLTSYRLLVFNKDVNSTQKNTLDFYLASEVASTKSQKEFIAWLDDSKKFSFDKVIFENDGKVKKDLRCADVEYFIKIIKELRSKKEKTSYVLSEKDDSSKWCKKYKTKTNLVFNTLYPTFSHIHGSFVSKIAEKIFHDQPYDDILQRTTSQANALNKILRKESTLNEQVVENIIKPLRQKDKVVVWYDFEGFSMPYPIFDYALPYRQIVFQVSVIKTINNQIISKENVVLDPRNLELSQYLDFIKTIYDPNACAYVVFNKSYENTRLREMVELYEITNLKTGGKAISQEQIDELKKMVDKIISEELCVDLENVFNYSKNAIYFHQLRGFSSIKKIEKLITKSKLQLPVMITPYSELEVQNGTMAMTYAICRYADTIQDNKWEEVVNNLKIYCENDVMAMIMAYQFIELVLEKGVNIIDKDLNIFE